MSRKLDDTRSRRAVATALTLALTLGSAAVLAEPAPHTCPRDARLVNDYLFLHSLGADAPGLTAPFPRGEPRIEHSPSRPHCRGEALGSTAPTRSADCTPPRPGRTG